MEDVLELYAEPYDAKRPKVNFDETSNQLIGETRQPLPQRPGEPARFDYEDERHGTRNLFLFIEPQAGFRHVAITDQRTMIDFAHQMKWLVDEAYPEAEVVRVIMDNLNRAQSGFFVRSVCAGGSAPDCQKAGVPLHAETRFVAQHGGD